jgi:hypothetical protein
MSETQPAAGMPRTTLTNIDIPFGRLIVIFIKFGLAAIPAAIVVSFILMLVGMALSAIFGPGFMFFHRGGVGI